MSGKLISVGFDLIKKINFYFKFKKCPKTFYGETALGEHCHAEHGTCKVCSRAFPRPATLARHYVNHQNK